MDRLVLKINKKVGCGYELFLVQLRYRVLLLKLGLIVISMQLSILNKLYFYNEVFSYGRLVNQIL